MLPHLNEIANKSRQSILNFLGLNYGCETRDGELEDCVNLCTDDFPCLTQRRPRKIDSSYISPTTLHPKNGLIVIDGTRVLFNGNNVGTVEAGRKQIATVGNIVVIFPDKKYYNVETGVFGSMEETYISGANEIKFTDSTITTTGENFNFRVGDAIKITGCTSAPENNKTLIVRSVEPKTLTFYNSSFTASTETVAITLKREVPDLDFICESNYRLWGCKGNTIYASKYSDPLNFSVFDGLTSDSYYIQVGSDGDFTGCIQYSSHICFFKENVLHKLYGSKPSNYQVVTSNVFGVQAGCERSMKIINETLYYLGRNGVYAYTGGIPDLVSENFGTVKFTDACAESDGNIYYISMKSDGKWGLYTYDIARTIWLKEDNTHVIDFANVEGQLYMLSGDDNNLYKMSDNTSDEVIEWSATFCKFTEKMNERKGYSNLLLRLDIERGSWVKVEISKDDKPFETIYTTHDDRAKTISVPIHPNRCDNFRVKLSGKGRCTIKSLIRDFHVGSEV